ncbi:MAG TPA: cupin domain-containing protein [Caulobacteraceae bacterium]|nr:cupin domain-containing protein [Caulobacteraceae bacterium]
MKTLLAHLSRIAPSPGFGARTVAEDKDERQLAKAVGLRQFGVNHLTLRPGARSARRHWHEAEDEFVYVLSGAVVLIDETGETEIGPGDFAGFPAGVANAHHLVNRSPAPAELLVVGTRKVGEERIHYPDEADPGPFTVVRDARGERI